MNKLSIYSIKLKIASKQMMIKTFLSKFLILVSALFFASPLFAKVATMDLCEKVIAEMQKDFPKKRKLFTAVKPECIKDAQGGIMIEMIFSANKNNEPADEYRDKMIQASSVNMRKIVCHQKEFTDLLQITDIRFSFKLEEGENIITSFDVNYETCQKESDKVVDIGSSVTFAECEKYIKTAKSQYPKKLSETVSVSSLGCRKGEHKSAALVFFNDINIESSPQEMAAKLKNDNSLRISLKKSYCNNGLTKGILQAMDISNVYRVKNQEFGQIITTIKDCD